MIDVLIVGGGPVGTFLASELALAGVTVSIVEKREQPVAHSRALGVHSRSLEIFDMRGLIDNFLAAGPTRPAFHFGFLPTLLDFSVLDTTHPYMLVIPQTQTETLLRARLEELGTTIQYGCNVVALEQNPEYVEVTIENTQGRSTLQAKFVVGCDGAGSTVRTQAGIAFPGSENDIASMIAELHVHKKPSFVTRFNEKGCVLAVPLGPDIYRFAIIDPQRAHIDTSVPVSFEEIEESLQRIVGTDFGIHDPQWFTRFGDRHAQAEVYHKGRVLLAGDAAHIHPPAGGQGLNVGLQDAMNLGWKLAAYLQGRAHYAVLQSYHTERHPVGQSLLQNTQVQMELMTSFSEAGQQLRSWISSLLQLQSVNRPLASQISGLSATYPPVFENMPVHPLIGSRLPDLSLRTPADSDEKLYRWLHNGNFVLLDFTDNIIPARLQHILEARKDLKMLQAHLAAPSAPLAQVQTMLIRPDSHVAWASDEQNHELRLHFLLEALSVWCNI